MDREATFAALDTEGTAITVFAEGWEQWRASDREVSAINEGRLLVLSEFRPTTPWRAGQAMQRNLTITLLSSEVYLIEAGTRGGTLDAGRRALKHGRQLFVLETGTWTPGNELLTREGGKRTPWRPRFLKQGE